MQAGNEPPRYNRDTLRYTAIQPRYNGLVGPNLDQFAVEQHPQKDLIVQRILDGVPLRKVGAGLVPHVSHSAVQRYKANVINPMLARAARTEAIIIGKNEDLDRAVSPIAVQNAKEAVQVAIKDAPVVSLFRQRLEKLHSRIDRAMDRAESAVRISTDSDGNEVVVGQDLGVLAPLINQAHKNLEMHGRATGELEPTGGASVAIQIVMGEAGPRISYATMDPGTTTIDAAAEVDGMETIGVLQARS